jgi:glutamyl-tRNA synthetase
MSEAPGLLGFLFHSDANIHVDDDAMPGAEGPQVLAAAASALEGVSDWKTESIEAALRVALLDELELKPRLAFGPLRSAISGKRISPPLFESMELLGKESTLARIATLRDRLAATT